MIEDIKNAEITNRPIPPQLWKCKPCRYKKQCHIYGNDNQSIKNQSINGTEEKQVKSSKKMTIPQKQEKAFPLKASKPVPKKKEKSLPSKASKPASKKLINRRDIDLDELVKRYKIKRFGKK